MKTMILSPQLIETLKQNGIKYFEGDEYEDLKDIKVLIEDKALGNSTNDKIIMK